MPDPHILTSLDSQILRFSNPQTLKNSRALLAEVGYEREVDEVLALRVRLCVLLVKRVHLMGREGLGEDVRHRIVRTFDRRIDDEHVERIAAGGWFGRFEHFPAGGLLFPLGLFTLLQGFLQLRNDSLKVRGLVGLYEVEDHAGVRPEHSSGRGGLGLLRGYRARRKCSSDKRYGNPS